MTLSFTVYGRAQPAGSKKAFALKKHGEYTGRVVVTDDAKHSRSWKHDVATAALPVAPTALLSGPVSLLVTFFFARPKGHYGSGRNAGVVKGSAAPYPAVKPDLTKLVRALEDALTGVIWRDDALVVRQVLYKAYGTPERAEVSITSLPTLAATTPALECYGVALPEEQLP